MTLSLAASVWRARLVAALTALACLVVGAGQGAAQEGPSIPAGNDPSLTTPPEPPGTQGTEERAKLLVQAIREDKPELAAPFFFPEAAFRQVKAIKDPDAYFKKLMRVYLEDVRAMRATLADPDHVEFVSFELGRQKRWVAKGGEANALPYWANYKAKITVKDKGKHKVLEGRVLITWDGQWYVTHLTRK